MKLILVQPSLGPAADRDNLDVIARLVEDARAAPSPDDVLVLPEHFDRRDSRDEYEAGVSELAVRFGCHVVGGSHHEARAEGRVNCGVVVAPDGKPLGRYEKLRPYAKERQSVGAGTQLGEFTINGRHVLTLICADFWFSDLFARASRVPDLLLVPALSVTRKPAPDYSRTLWRHLAVARAYEFGTYVGISDWAHPSQLSLPASGVGGFADPTTVNPDELFRPIGASGVGVFAVDFEALDAFRSDRGDRGFFWKKPSSEPRVGRCR